MINQRTNPITRQVSFALLALVAFASSIAEAYIPHSHTIVGRLVRNNGKGTYVIEQEVQFRTAGDPLTLRERWVVENGETMRLLVSSPSKAGGEPVYFEASYSGGRKSAPDAFTLQPAKSATLSPEFAEGLFHARSTSGFLTALHRARIVPPGSLRDRPRFSKIEQVKYNPEPNVRLGRTSGVVTWIFGEATPVSAGKLSPAAWVEQDAFLLRRIRFPSEAEVTADRFASYANNLKLPRERTITWGNNSALIRVLSVRQTSQPPAREPGTKTTHLPDIAQVREFYSRFR